MTLLWVFVLLALDQPAGVSSGPAREGFVTIDDDGRLRYREVGVQEIDHDASMVHHGPRHTWDLELSR